VRRDESNSTEVVRMRCDAKLEIFEGGGWEGLTGQARKGQEGTGLAVSQGC
jgi:hypothetical protein